MKLRTTKKRLKKAGLWERHKIAILSRHLERLSYKIMAITAKAPKHS